jgi:hypothetical protein
LDTQGCWLENAKGPSAGQAYKQEEQKGKRQKQLGPGAILFVQDKLCLLKLALGLRICFSMLDYLSF